MGFKKRNDSQLQTVAGELSDALKRLAWVTAGVPGGSVDAAWDRVDLAMSKLEEIAGGAR